MSDNYNNNDRRRRLDPNETRIVDMSGAGGQQPESYQPVESQRSGYIPRQPRPDEEAPYEDQPTVAVPRYSYDQDRPRPQRPVQPPQQPQADQRTYTAPQRPPRPIPQYDEPQPQPREPFAQPVPRRGVGAVPSPAQTTPKRRGRWGLVFGILAGLLVLVLLGTFAYAGWYEQQYAGRIYPGVTVLGENLGGLDPNEATAVIQRKTAGFTDHPVTLVWQDKQWTPNQEQLGLKINVDATVDEAFAVGRDGGLIDNWVNRYNVSVVGKLVPLTVSIDERSVQNYLQTEVQPQIDTPMQQGEVWLQGEQINKTDSKIGYSLRSFDALTAISQGLATMTANQVQLPVDELKPTVSQAEIDQVAQQLGTLLSGPIVVKYNDKQYTVERAKLSTKVLSLKRSLDPNAEHHYTVEFQEDNLKDMVEYWATDINIGPQSARFDWNGGNLRPIKESSDGVKVEVDPTVKAIEAAMNTLDQRTVNFVVTITPAKVSSKDIASLGIKELLSTGTSSFPGSTAERATNIKVAADHLHGAVIPPGDEFSFLDTLGPITTDRGFVEGYVIQAERTQKGVGGGVCQVSTTVFRAAFFAGLDITVRAPHAYRVSWYESNGEPVGFDAAVFDPGVDLRFINDSPGYILLQTWIDGDTLNVGFFGTPTGQEVKLVNPTITNRTPPPADVYQLDPNLAPGTTKQVETAHQGLDASVTRQIIKDGQVVHEETFSSHYEAWPNWFMVAPDVKTPSPPRPPDNTGEDQ